MPDIAPLLINSREAARMLGISSRTLWGWTVSGDIESVRCGRILRYDPEVLRQWVAAHRTSGRGRHTNSNGRDGTGRFLKKT